DAPLPRIEAQHDLAEGDGIEAALGGGADGQCGHELSPAARATASAVSVAIWAKSSAATSSRGTIHEPPTASTALMARYSCRFFGPMPPVGTKPSPPKGAARALIAAAPPLVPAGKNFTAARPSSRAVWTSV